MPLWLDLLRTPMAAPETVTLKRMRRTWQGLCVVTALWIGLFGPIHRALGLLAPAIAMGMLVGTALYSGLYLSRKHRADTLFLEKIGEIE